MPDGPGWLPDPEVEDQERYWDGDDWTDLVRPAMAAGDLHLPEHVPELHRALAAATADIDAVEDRLSSLFDRTGEPAGAGAVRRQLPGLGSEADMEPDDEIADDDFDDFDFEDEEDDEDGDDVDGDVKADGEVADDEFDDLDFDDEDEDEVASVGTDGPEPRLHEEFQVRGLDADVDSDGEDEDDDAFAELDAALAAEMPDEPDRRFFRRRS